jgi:hypothetical protein
VGEGPRSALRSDTGDLAEVAARLRRLKELGLTESLPVGYRLSPRGQALLDSGLLS